MTAPLQSNAFNVSLRNNPKAVSVTATMRIIHEEAASLVCRDEWAISNAAGESGYSEIMFDGMLLN